jgi:acetyl-CoA carboxylase carboxyl transferase subunit alpha
MALLSTIYQIKNNDFESNFFINLFEFGYKISCFDNIKFYICSSNYKQKSIRPMEYLDFELPIKELEDQLDKCLVIGQESDVDVTNTCKQINKKLEETKRHIYKNLTAWQRVQLSRHPNRPYTLDHIKALCGDTFLELHGDRGFKDDKAMIGGLGKIDGQSFMIIGQQKGYNTKTRQYRNFGMANPEGYRKALRLMKMAEKFGIPVLSLVDTPGAFPGIEAEERGQGEAIARNILEMVRLKVPIIVVIVGEGASGGALGIGVGDRVYMMENTWYSVISPESCSSILWKSWDYKEQAAEALKLTSTDMKKQKLVDDIIPEPLGGAHFDRETSFKTVEQYIMKGFNELKDLSTEELVAQRMDKYSKMGEFKD